MAELLYEVMGVSQAQRCLFSVGGGNSQNTTYCDWAGNSSNLFGCIALKNKQFCILNKQYSREEYEKLTARIREHMDEIPYIDVRKREYRFGEFFPPELSAYSYNESFAFPWYRKTKEQVLAEGWKWQDPHERSYDVTVRPEKLPDHIRDVVDSITQETIGCMHAGTCNEQCATAFRITPEELAFYREMNIALPRICPSCRYAERLKWRNSFHLWQRVCMCMGKQSETSKAHITYANTTPHFHGQNTCSNEFETTYAPEQSEIVYCDSCYKAEFL
jgi:hypothetical protein